MADRTRDTACIHAAAVREADEWWYHARHGLHDREHHLAHRPLDACVPLLTRTDALRRIREDDVIPVTESDGSDR